jgi:hypothetical protein
LPRFGGLEASLRQAESEVEIGVARRLGGMVEQLRIMARKREAKPDERRKLIAFDQETWNALDLLARDSMSTIQELADEAFRDLLRKHNRAVDLKTALRMSAAETSTKGQGVTKRKLDNE